MSAEHGPWVAVINWGRWIAECPQPRCAYAYALKPEQAEQACRADDGGGCGYTAPVQWPGDAAALTTELGVRPVEADRNWAPAGHRQTHVSRTPSGKVVAEEYPDGQTVADLRAENRERDHGPPRPSDPEDVRVRADAVLAEMGFRLDPDNPGQLRRL